MNHIALLLNPSSGKGRGIKQKKYIESLFKKYSLPYDMFVTESEAHLRSLAAKFAGKYPIIAAAGGDTTFNIVATEILKLNPSSLTGDNDNKYTANITSLAMFGTGSANDITRSLGINSLEKACQTIKYGTVHLMDVGTVTLDGIRQPHFFLGTLSLGLGTTVNRYVESYYENHPFLSRINPLSQLTAGLLGIHHSFKTQKVPMPIELTLINQHNQPISTQNLICSLPVFLNTPYYANGLNLSKMNPSNALPNLDKEEPYKNNKNDTPLNNRQLNNKKLKDHPMFDGKLDCCVIQTTSLMNTLRTGIGISRGHKLDKERRNQLGVMAFREIAFRVGVPAVVDIQVDGEIISGVSGFCVSVIPNVLPVRLI